MTKNQQQTNSKKGTLFVVSGPSGSGKSTLCRAVLERTDARLSISATTRQIGTGETDGQNYYFLSEQEFLDKVRAGEFLEYARVFDYYYGTPAAPVREMLDQGLTIILEIDVQGAAQVFERFPEARGILVVPPEPAELRRRLCDRGRDDTATIEKRLAQARREVEQAREGGCYQYTIVNGDLEKAIDEMVKLIDHDEDE